MTKTKKTALCRECGASYVIARFWQKFCSKKCKAEFHKRETALAREAWRAKGEEKKPDLDDILD